ncbi:MAG: hypothetical protein LBQ66_00660 [Planctomycetaceae bacterium]|jgi:hypothetical protein|nr:hypothetical protein [Planctomycetaceae bacterium]
MLDQKRFLFRFKFPCAYLGVGESLGESYRLPDVSLLESSEVGVSGGGDVDFRVGWNERGFAVAAKITSKKQSLWCRAVSPNESDGVQICLDTRDLKTVHRATQFCHRLVFLPMVSDAGRSEPSAFWLPIHRAKLHPNPIDVTKIKLKSKIFNNGYELSVFIPQEVLTGFEPIEYPSLGFHFVLVDREIGNRYFLVAPPFPYDQDPSIWGTLELVRNQ